MVLPGIPNGPSWVWIGTTTATLSISTKVSSHPSAFLHNPRSRTGCIDFVITRGGEYFFSPPVSAIKGKLAEMHMGNGNNTMGAGSQHNGTAAGAGDTGHAGNTTQGAGDGADHGDMGGMGGMGHDK